MANDYALLVSASEKHTKVQDFCKIPKSFMLSREQGSHFVVQYLCESSNL